MYKEKCVREIKNIAVFEECVFLDHEFPVAIRGHYFVYSNWYNTFVMPAIYLLPLVECIFQVWPRSVCCQ